MTEIALALAMAFFSLMVLTMISMGAGGAKTAPAATAELAPARSGAATATQPPGPEDVVVVYYGGRFLDTNLRPVDPSALGTTKRVVLALDPALPLDKALHVRASLSLPNLIVSTLDERWLAALRRTQP